MFSLNFEIEGNREGRNYSSLALSTEKAFYVSRYPTYNYSLSVRHAIE